MNNYSIKVNKGLIKEIKPFWLDAKKAEDDFLKELNRIEKELEKLTGINIELFRMDGELVGIGNYSRTMRLIRGKELKK